MKTITMDYETYLKETNKTEWLKQLNKDLIEKAHHIAYERINKVSIDISPIDTTKMNTGMIVLTEELNRLISKFND